MKDGVRNRNNKPKGSQFEPLNRGGTTRKCTSYLGDVRLCQMNQLRILAVTHTLGIFGVNVARRSRKYTGCAVTKNGGNDMRVTLRPQTIPRWLRCSVYAEEPSYPSCFKASDLKQIFRQRCPAWRRRALTLLHAKTDKSPKTRGEINFNFGRPLGS